MNKSHVFNLPNTLTVVKIRIMQLEVPPPLFSLSNSEADESTGDEMTADTGVKPVLDSLYLHKSHTCEKKCALIRNTLLFAEAFF
jgi:hypothetical protein